MSQKSFCLPVCLEAIREARLIASHFGRATGVVSVCALQKSMNACQRYWKTGRSGGLIEKPSCPSCHHEALRHGARDESCQTTSGSAGKRW